MDASILEEIARSGSVVAVRVSPEGNRIAFLCKEDGRTEGFIADLDGGGYPQRFTVSGVPQPEHGDAGPNWSPDGKYIATLVPSQGGADVAVVSVDDGVFRIITDGHLTCASPRWSPNGRWVAFLVTRKPKLRKVDDPPELWDVAIDSADPRHTSSVFGGVALWITNTSGSVVRRVALPDLSFTDFDWSPTSSSVVASALDTRTAYGQLLQIQFGDEGHEITNLVESGTQQFRSPRFSKDGRVAYLADRTGYLEVYIWDGNIEHQVTSDECDKGELVWGEYPEDETLLLYTRFDTGELRIESVTLNDSKLSIEALTHSGVVRNLAVSGSLLTYIFESPSQAPEAYLFDLRKRQQTQISHSTVLGLASRLPLHFEPIRYTSSKEIEIEGFFASPQNSGDQLPPLIVYPHGGPTSVFLRGWNPFLAWLVKQGYAVFAPNFRGSTMYGRAFEKANDYDWGGGDLDDIVRSVEALSEAGLIDSSRAAVFGGSYGGYLTLLALAKYPEVFRCGIDWYGVSNRYSSWLTTDRFGRHNMEKEMGHMATNRNRYQEASPLFFVDQIEAPLLILHGQDDARVPLGQSEELVAALKSAGKFHIYHTYPAEGHGFQHPKNIADAYARVTAFLANFL